MRTYSAVAHGAPIAFRCDNEEHETLPPTNSNAAAGAECAACTAEAFVEAFEKAFEKTVFWPVVTMARDRLNLLAPGAGDQFQGEARALINAARILSDADDQMADPVELLRAIIYASDGCQGHRGCNHSMDPWKNARAFLERHDGE